MAISKDIDWIKYSFVLAGERMQVSRSLARYRNLSSADFKFTSSGFGEDTVINPRPQFTPFADIRSKGLWATTAACAISDTSIEQHFIGMGRAYSEMFHDTRQTVHIRFGVTQYKGLLTFFTGFYDQESAVLARQGRASLSYYFGLILGTVATLALAPITLPLFILAGTAMKYLMGRTSTKYMTLKPTMPLFWERTQVIMNNIGANLGIIARTMDNTGIVDNSSATKIVDSNGKSVSTGGVNDIDDLRAYQNSQNYKEYMHRLMPDIFKKDGRLDVQRSVLGGARKMVIWNNRISNIANMAGSTSANATYEAILDYLSQPISTSDVNKNTLTMETYLESYHKGVMGSIENKNLDNDNAGQAVEDAISTGDVNKVKELKEVPGTTNSESDAGSSAVTGATGDTSSQTSTDAFNSATSGSVSQDATTTQASQSEADTASSGIDTAALTAALNKTKPQEMMTVLRAKNESALTTAEEEKSGIVSDIISGTGAKIAEGYEVVQGWLTTAAQDFEAEWNNGSAFLNLAVNYTGSGSMTISNATKETTISGTLKGISTTTRDMRISASDFKSGFGMLDTPIQMLTDLFTGGLDAIKMSGLMALAGNAYTDIPKQWDDSNATVPTANFTIELRTVAGNQIMQYLHQYTTIAALLAGATPLSTGPQSYTAPFVCEAYSRGAFAIRYGMIQSLTIKHAVGNLGYTDDRRPLGFDIDVEIIDLSSIYHASISNGMNPVNIFKRIFDDDNIFNDYLSTITGMSIDDMVDPRRKLNIRLANQMANVKSWWSPTHIASRLAGTTPVQTLNKIFGPSTFPGM